MKIVNGQKIFKLEVSEQELGLLSKFLANQDYLERTTLLNSINQQIQEQQRPTPIRDGEFATEGRRECSPAIVK